MIASIIRLQQYANDFATLFLGATAGLEEMYNNRMPELKKIFDEVYWTDVKKMNEYNREYTYNWRKLLRSMYGRDFSDYDEIFFYNMGGAFSLIYKSLKIGFHKFKVHWYEEGFGSYIWGDKFIMERFPMNRVIDNLYLLYTQIVFRGYHPSYIAKGDAWFANPDMIVGKMHRRTKHLFLETPSDKLKKSILSCYSYYNFEIPIKEKYIFMGECLDGGPWSNEKYVKLIGKIAEYVGYDNFFYKEHPRNPFKIENERIHTFDLSIPWEVIEFAQDLADKVCITSLSGACINSKYLFSTKTKVICIWPMFADDYRLFEINKTKEFLAKLLKNHSDFLVVNNEERLFELLEGGIGVGAPRRKS